MISKGMQILGERTSKSQIFLAISKALEPIALTKYAAGKANQIPHYRKRVHLPSIFQQQHLNHAL